MSSHLPRRRRPLEVAEEQVAWLLEHPDVEWAHEEIRAQLRAVRQQRTRTRQQVTDLDRAERLLDGARVATLQVPPDVPAPAAAWHDVDDVVVSTGWRRRARLAAACMSVGLVLSACAQAPGGTADPLVQTPSSTSVS